MALVAGVGLWLLVALLIHSMISCATPRDINHHEGHVIVADTMATEAKSEWRASEQRDYIDSLVKTMMAHYQQETTSQEQQTETTTENITETVDSLGRKLRQEQRTITRSISREEQIRMQAWQTQMEQRITQELARRDSMWKLKFQQYQNHWADSLSTTHQETVKEDVAMPWWLKVLWSIFLLGVAVIVAYFAYIIITFIRENWIKNLKKD